MHGRTELGQCDGQPRCATPCLGYRELREKNGIERCHRGWRPGFRRLGRGRHRDGAQIELLSLGDDDAINLIDLFFQNDREIVRTRGQRRYAKRAICIRERVEQREGVCRRHTRHDRRSGDRLSRRHDGPRDGSLAGELHVCQIIPSDDVDSVQPEASEALSLDNDRV